MNALDNRAARNHVNRMCLAADVPLLESGTAGYNGQVAFTSVIFPFEYLMNPFLQDFVYLCILYFLTLSPLLRVGFI